MCICTYVRTNEQTNPAQAAPVGGPYPHDYDWTLKKSGNFFVITIIYGKIRGISKSSGITAQQHTAM